MSSTHTEIQSGTSKMCEDALRNSLVLENIFQNFSTKFLLASCSLVNKTWNREARKFVRDHRTCSVSNQFYVRPTGLCYCQFFNKLHDLCLQMVQNGRVIPWNVLVMRKPWGNTGCPRRHFWMRDDDDLTFPTGDTQLDFKDHLNLKQLHVCFSKLEIQWGIDDVSCPGFKLLLKLVRECSTTLISMKIEKIDALEILLRDWQPNFPRLEEISIAKHGQRIPSSMRKEDVTKLLNGAPNLKRIDDMTMVSLYPEDKFGLFVNLEFKPFTVKEMTFLKKIASKKPRLREIRILQPVPFPPEGDNEPGDKHPQLNPTRILRRLLRRSVQSLQTVAVVGVSPLFDQLYLPPFMNLTTLTFRLTCFLHARDFWDAIAAIDYSHQMPKLQKIYIRLAPLGLKAFENPCWYCHDQRGCGTCAEWPAGSNLDDASFGTAPSIRALSLDLEIRRVNLTAIRAKFPLVTSLNLKLGDTYPRMDPTALCQMWGLWPTLEELELAGDINPTTRNFDADFCGIYEEEAQMPREMSEEYLEAVHIVPIRPSVSTMLNLKKLRMNFRFKDGGHLTFISKVTELVAFKRMKHTEVDIHFACEAPPRPNPWAFADQMEFDPYSEHPDDFHDQQVLAMERTRTPSPPRPPSPRIIRFPITNGNNN